MNRNENLNVSDDIRRQATGTQAVVYSVKYGAIDIELVSHELSLH